MAAASTGAPAQGRVLPEGYYLENFETILTTVTGRDEDLLGAEEHAFLAAWANLSLAARRLYVRLLSRKGPLLRRDRLAYAEIPALDAALAELAAAGFADAGTGASPAELLALPLRAELRELADALLGAAAPPRTARRDELAAALAGFAADAAGAARLEEAIRDRLHPVRPLRLAAVTVFRLLFFGNLGQDWTEFVLRDLGVVRFEPYDLRRELRVFPDRSSLDDTLTLAACRTTVWERLEAGELAAAVALGREVLARPEGWREASRRHFDRLCLQLGHALERAGDGEGALAFYESTALPPARERRARILDGLGRSDDALALCTEIAAAPRDETEVDFAPRFAERLRRRRGEARERRRRPPLPSVTMALPDWDGPGVEAAALAAFAAAGRPGCFAENWLWKALVGLAFWDVVFAPVKGAFQHPFQYGPLDFHSPDFRRAREELVAARLAELRAEERPGPRLLAVHDAKVGTANPWVGWGEGLRPALELALSRLGGVHLAAVCDRLSRDPRRYGRGLPDLFVLADAEPGFELYEVKSPSDQLRPEQGSWIDYLNEHGLPTRVLKVTD